MTHLAPFPTDDETLALIDHALDTTSGRSSLGDLLDILSGYDPSKCIPLAPNVVEYPEPIYHPPRRHPSPDRRSTPPTERNSMSASKRSPHFLRFEWADQWWQPSSDVLQMTLTSTRPRPDVLEVTLFGHATPLPLNPVPVRVRCSWDRIVYWVGTSRMWTVEVSASGGEPTLEYAFHGQFERETEGA